MLRNPSEGRNDPISRWAAGWVPRRGNFPLFIQILPISGRACAGWHIRVSARCCVITRDLVWLPSAFNTSRLTDSLYQKFPARSKYAVQRGPRWTKFSSEDVTPDGDFYQKFPARKSGISGEEVWEESYMARLLAGNIFSEDVLAGNFNPASWVTASLLDGTYGKNGKNGMKWAWKGSGTIRHKRCNSPMVIYTENRNRIRIEIYHYLVYCSTSIVPIVKRKSILISDWLKWLRWISF